MSFHSAKRAATIQYRVLDQVLLFEEEKEVPQEVVRVLDNSISVVRVLESSISVQDQEKVHITEGSCVYSSVV